MRTIFCDLGTQSETCVQNLTEKIMKAHVIRMRELCEVIKQAKSTVHTKLDPTSKYFDADFPRPISLSDSPRGAKAWLVSEVEAWLELRAQKSRATNESMSSRNQEDNRDKFEIPPQSKTLGVPAVRKKLIRNEEASGAAT